MADTDRIRRPEERVVQVAAPAAAAPSESEAGRPSIAVLPFANMSGDPEQEYFADGMVEEIITGLSRIRWLTVIARNSSFAYKGTSPDVRAVGRELNVRYVLEGSVRKGGDRVRITGQLIEAETGGHLWADKFDGKLEDVFDLQDQVTAAVVGAIEPSVRKAEIERVKRKRPDNLDAYDLYLRALAHVYERNHPRAVEALDRALAIDPDYAEAHGLAARTYGVLYVTFGGGPAAREAALAHALAVQTLGSDDAWTLANAAAGLYSAEGDRETALGLIHRALAENANLAAAYSYGAALQSARGDASTAIEWGERALRLAPFDPMRSMALMGICTARRLLGEHEAALAAARETVRINARITPGHVYVVSCLVRLGRLEEARAAAAQLVQINPAYRVSHLKIPVPDIEQLRTDLRAAGVPE